MRSQLAKLEKFLGGLKFAVILLGVFALYMIIGTFTESYYGTEYANRLIYKSWGFMLLQALLFICIFMAALLRLPAKKRLRGFYLIHAGLLIIIGGSFVSYHSGIDGKMTLFPGKNSTDVLLPQEELKIAYPDQQKEVLYQLPYTPGEKNLDENYQGIQLKRFLPFADNQQQWLPSTQASQSSVYLLANPMVQQEFIMSLHEGSDYLA